MRQIVDMDKNTCIYCKQEKDMKYFTTEHVIPRSFGTFGAETLVLDCVCSDCNTFFGNNLELQFARGSYEGIQRFECGIKPQAEIKSILSNRMTIRLAEEGIFKGALATFEPNPNGDKPAIQLVPQVGFLKKNSIDRDFFTLHDLENCKVFKKEKYDMTKTIVYVNKSNEERMELILRKFEMTLNNGEKLKKQILDGEILGTSLNYRIDDIIRRTIAKISFNYLANKMGTEFAIRHDFDAIRDFIRYGTKSHYNSVLLSNQPILKQDRMQYRQTKGHLIILETENNWVSIIAKISLMNTLTYKVILCKYFSGIKRRIAIGNHFDFANKKIDKLFSLPKGMYPF